MIVSYESHTPVANGVAHISTKEGQNKFAEFFTQQLQSLRDINGSNSKVELANTYSEQLEQLNQRRLSSLELTEKDVSLPVNEEERWAKQTAINQEYHNTSAELRISYGKAQMGISFPKDDDGNMKIQTPADLGGALCQYADEQRVAQWHRSELRSGNVEADITQRLTNQLEVMALRAKRDADDFEDGVATENRIREYRNMLYTQMTSDS